MTKLKLCNVHKLALSNEGERKSIHIPFGTWEYDSNITQTFDRPHAENMASLLAKHVANGEPGIPVYQGHPDVPEYASKYPDKGALGWIRKMIVNEDGVDCIVDWDRDPGKGFAWFSPYWVGDNPSVGPDGKRNVIIDGINSIGLVNNPNIHEFRLANEAQPEERKTMKPYQLPQRIIDLANEYDESKHPRAEDGKWTSGGGGGGSGGGASIKKVDPASTPGHRQEQEKNRQLDAQVAKNRQRTSEFFAKRANYEAKLQSTIRRAGTRLDHANIINAVFSHYPNDDAATSAAHRTAIYAGLKYNHKLRRYE